MRRTPRAVQNLLALLLHGRPGATCQELLRILRGEDGYSEGISMSHGECHFGALPRSLWSPCHLIATDVLYHSRLAQEGASVGPKNVSCWLGGLFAFVVFLIDRDFCCFQFGAVVRLIKVSIVLEVLARYIQCRA